MLVVVVLFVVLLFNDVLIILIGISYVFFSCVCVCVQVVKSKAVGCFRALLIPVSIYSSCIYIYIHEQKKKFYSKTKKYFTIVNNYLRF